ncbi:MAG TPA: Fe-S protein assembly co-chaperone HscB [Gammaproteobacteria bacterium]
MTELDLKKNYFELFGLPVQFELAEPELSARYRDLQRACHPDRMANADDRQQRRAVQAAAHVNEAYRVLRSPMDRAVYLLELAGQTGEAPDKLAPEFLMQQIQLREELEAIPGTDNPRECLLELSTRTEQEIRRYYDFFQNQMGQRQYAVAGDTVRKLQFLHKLRDEIDELQFDLEEELD